ncbi:hypothetical protein [Methylicorpusculum sp.]|uniref:hypothetical protein n=1 Tax=Methylicorpusculum sp. TaxID=2713644 RepID=UPI00272F0117|nr:hypothetical protein [Methylicorpusculum sp.]MDP2177300.1 hypothetical protein [Methylicorpusculum sp.]MDP3529409.1 hypothetical protein [Methylicorpusculum sp.]
MDFEEPAENWISAVIPHMAEGASSSTTAFIDMQTPAKEAPKYSRKNPFPGRLTVNRLLTTPDSSKETRHYEISIAGSEMTYEAGEAFGVIPMNCPDLVAEIIKAIGYEGEYERLPYLV